MSPGSVVLMYAKDLVDYYRWVLPCCYSGESPPPQLNPVLSTSSAAQVACL